MSGRQGLTPTAAGAYSPFRAVRLTFHKSPIVSRA